MLAFFIRPPSWVTWFVVVMCIVMLYGTCDEVAAFRKTLSGDWVVLTQERRIHHLRLDRARLMQTEDSQTPNSLQM